MFEIKKHFEKIKTDFINDCTECGACVEACPYVSMGLLAGTDPVEISEKRLALLKDHEYSDTAYQYSRGCMLCGACETACPMEINPYLINIVSRLELAHWEKPISEKYAGDVANLTPLLPGSPFNIFKAFCSLQIKPHEVCWFSEIPRNPEPADVVLFLSCQVLSRSDRIFTTIDIMRSLNVEFAALGGVDFCCGFLDTLAGKVTETEKHIDKIARAMDAFQAKTFVVDCTSCCGWLRDLSQLAELPFHFQHMTQFVDDHIEALEPQSSFDATAVFHDACHFGRHQGESEPPRKILEAIPGMHLVEMEHNRENTLCCGGPASGYQPELAALVRKNRLEEARKTGAEILLTACDGCLSFFKGGAEGYPFEIETLDNFLGKALGIEHENRLAKLQSCKSIDEILELAKGCLWEDTYSETEMRKIVGSIFNLKDT
jgi:Fe-S oxidoreductase